VLEKFLETKPLYYNEIDYSRMPRIYSRIEEHFILPTVIHIIGTNGKGTTGRFLATALFHKSYNVGHYTSPHILEFNERIWFNGEDVSMQRLEEVHQKLLSILTQKEADSLSYFEYTTLLAMLFFSKKSDFIILEAGLGGEYDATAVFTNNLTLVTPIDRDHEAFLGNTIEAIAKTKLSAIQKSAILATQNHDDTVFSLLERLEKEKDIESYRAEELLELKDSANITAIMQRESLPAYLKENLSLAIAALKYLKEEYTPDDFKNSKLFGRLSSLDKNILVDVGHNVLAAKSILATLKDEKYILVYNSYKDKDYRTILTILKPIIEEVHVIDIYNSRIEDSNYLQTALDDLSIQWKKFEMIENDKKYLVFGSFSVVEAFLRIYNG